MDVSKGKELRSWANDRLLWTIRIVYCRGQNAANDAFETLRRGRKKEKSLFDNTTKSSNLRIAMYVFSFFSIPSTQL